jgi:hypothetical protein
MAKTPTTKAAPDTVSVRLKCIYSGFPGNPGPGDIVAVDQDEAKRLVSLGAADEIRDR